MLQPSRIPRWAHVALIAFLVLQTVLLCFLVDELASRSRGPALASLTTNTVPKATSLSTLANSVVTDDGTSLSLGTTFVVTEANGQIVLTNVGTINNLLTVTATNATEGVDSSVTQTLTTRGTSAIAGRVSGTVDTTTGSLTQVGGNFTVNTTLGAGANPLNNNALSATVSGSTTSNVAIVASATGTGNIDFNGTHGVMQQADVAFMNSSVFVGPTDNMYISGDGILGCKGTTNAAATCVINGYGYAPGNTPGTTQNRDLSIQDGKGNQVIRTHAATLGADVFGPLTATTITTGGTATPSVWTNGVGAPAASCNSGDLYSNRSGGVLTTLYVCTAANTWTAK